MRPDHPADLADVGERPEPVAHLLAAAAHRRERLGIGQCREHALDLLVDRRGEQRERLGARLLGREMRIGGIGGQRVVQERRHLPQARRVLGQPVGIRAERLPCERPPVPVRGHELLQDRERGLERPPLVGRVALERGDVLEAAVGEEAQHLELGVHARLDPAVELEHELLVEHDRAVRLLDAHRPDRGRLGEILGAVEVDRRLLELQRRARPHQPDELAHQLRVDDRVVDGPAAGLRDHRLLPAFLGGPEPERQVVEVVALQPVPDLDDPEREDRRPARRDARVEHPRVEHVARLAGEPALRRDRPEQDEAVQEVQVALLDASLELGAHEASLSSSAGSWSWNQKKPRGPSVSR